MIKLPGLGEVKTPYVIGGVGLTLGIVGYAWYKHRQNAGSATASTAAADGGTAAIDPQTGLPEGSPADLAALQALDGGTAAGGVGEDIGGAGGSLGAGGQALYYDPADGLYDLTSPYTGTGTGTSTSTANTGPGTFTDNAYWVQYAVANVVGYTGSQIQGALAVYLAGQGMTSTEMTIYQASLAVAGPPPSPPSQPAHLSTTTPGAGKPKSAPSDLKTDKITSSSATASWGKVTGATGYDLVAWEAIKGTPVIYRGTVTGTSYDFAGLKSKAKYGWYVAASDAAGEGPHTSNQHFTTK